MCMSSTKGCCAPLCLNQRAETTWSFGTMWRGVANACQACVPRDGYEIASRVSVFAIGGLHFVVCIARLGNTHGAT